MFLLDLGGLLQQRRCNGRRLLESQPSPDNYHGVASQANQHDRSAQLVLLLLLRPMGARARMGDYYSYSDYCCHCDYYLHNNDQ